MNCLNWESSDNNEIKIISKCVKEVLSINIFVILSICDLPLIFFMTDDRYKVNVSKNIFLILLLMLINAEWWLNYDKIMYNLQATIYFEHKTKYPLKKCHKLWESKKGTTLPTWSYFKQMEILGQKSLQIPRIFQIYMCSSSLCNIRN